MKTQVETLDWVDILNVDLIVRPYEWTVNGKSGVKAYLQSIYVTIEEDPLEIKYSEMEPIVSIVEIIVVSIIVLLSVAFGYALGVSRNRNE